MSLFQGRLIIAKLDRLGRSLPHLLQLFAELEAHKCALIVPGQGIDTSDGNPCGRLMRNILGSIAEFERDLIRERTRAGLESARRRGAKLGRPRLTISPEQSAMISAFKGTVKELAGRLGCSVGKAHSLLASR